MLRMQFPIVFESNITLFELVFHQQHSYSSLADFR